MPVHRIYVSLRILSKEHTMGQLSYKGNPRGFKSYYHKKRGLCPVFKVKEKQGGYPKESEKKRGR